MILGNDPLLTGDVDLAVVLIVLVKAAITLGVVLLATMLMIWFERKAISGLQNRIGPNRAGIIRQDLNGQYHKISLALYWHQHGPDHLR